MEDIIVIDIVDHIAAGEQQVMIELPLYKAEIFIICADIPYLRMGDFAFLIDGQIEQAVLFPGQIPFLAGTDMIQDGPAVERQQQSHCIHTGIHHRGQGKIDEPELPRKRFRCHGTGMGEAFHIIGPLQVDQPDDFIIH